MLSLSLICRIYIYISQRMTKPTNWHVRPVKIRCLYEESFGLELPIERTAKTLIRLGGCPGRC